MAWEVKDEWIDLAAAKHVVIFHNKDVLVPGQATGQRIQPPMVPLKHYLIHEFKHAACLHCGGASAGEQKIATDFAQLKRDTHDALKAHHAEVMAYREKHPAVRLDSGPKA